MASTKKIKMEFEVEYKDECAIDSEGRVTRDLVLGGKIVKDFVSRTVRGTITGHAQELYLENAIFGILPNLPPLFIRAHEEVSWSPSGVLNYYCMDVCTVAK